MFINFDFSGKQSFLVGRAEKHNSKTYFRETTYCRCEHIREFYRNWMYIRASDEFAASFPTLHSENGCLAETSK